MPAALAALGGLVVGIAIGAVLAAKVMGAAWIDLLKDAEAKGRIVVRR